MQGDYVIARSFGNVPLIRRVWEAGEGIVYICTEERFNQLKLGNTDLMLVGFPKEDVFEYDETVVPKLNTDPNIWLKLKPWHGMEEQ